MTKTIFELLLVLILVISTVLSSCGPPLHPQSLGEYLQDLFVGNGIVLSEDDFLEPVDDPYLAYAVMLNLIPAYYGSEERITETTAEQISEQLLAVKDQLYLDGL